jgi:formylglycine-generating enzyme required for sulfatase activity
MGFCNEHSSGLDKLVPVESMPMCQANGIYDLIGNAGEWEDGCAGTAGETDTCPFRGGAFDTPTDGSTASCTTVITTSRQTTAAHLGFRCCAE